MKTYLSSKVRDIDDEGIHQLLKELEMITNVRIDFEDSSAIFHYISQCIHPNGSGPAVPITRDDLDAKDPLDAFLLRKKIKNMSDLPVYTLCAEIAQHFKEGIERHEGKSLYVFINYFFSRILKEKKPIAGKRRLFQ